ncbi:hypothetical protein RN001_012073 [Aquatica leii]|uniref:Glutaminyl-tRNA synthetase class Ib non-specific RNA-binding domain-containing protein n=1 Tax=Aquatica leii TaxID=1421715 RepID=A0AAN7P5D5_9COLE|nr:hypothetical protein RN001_012073 [Aquatica leii]
MTSRNDQKLQHSTTVHVHHNPTNSHKHHRHHDMSDGCQMQNCKSLDKPVQQAARKNEHGHDYKIDEDVPSDVQIRSISGLLHNERHNYKKAKLHDPKLLSDAVINMNQFCGNCHLPKLSESGENTKSIVDNVTLTKPKINSKSCNASFTSKYVQTSKTKLKQRRLKQVEEFKRHSSRSPISSKVVSKSKKEIYIITSNDTAFKFPSISQERLCRKNKCDKKTTFPIESNIEKIDDNSNTKPINEHKLRETEFSTGGPHTALEEVLKHSGVLSLIAKEKNKREDVSATKAKTKDVDYYLENTQNFATEISHQVFGKYKDMQSGTNHDEMESKKREYHKVISTKLKHRQKKNDVTLIDKAKSGEERSQKRHKKEHYHKHAKNSVSIENGCVESEEKIASSKDVSSLLPKQSLPNNFRKQRFGINQEPHLPNEDLEVCRKRILDNIEKAYSKHKHILPKEAVEALDRNIKQWRSMDIDIGNKSSDQISNVLDLEEVLKKNRKEKTCNNQHQSEKILTTEFECTLPSVLKKTFKPNNDLILLNAIVTGVNGLDCDKETVHVNKIPKFVRLEEMVCEPNTTVNKRVLSKLNVIHECPSGSQNHFINSMEDAVSKPVHAGLHQMTFDDDVRKEVSFSQLNVQPVISLYYANDQQFNYINNLLPSLLRDRRIIKSRKKRICIEKDLLNIFTSKETVRDENVSGVILNPVTKLAKSESVFNVKGVEPSKKKNLSTSPAHEPTANEVSSLKKLDVVVLPVLEISSRCKQSKFLNEEVFSPSIAKLLKNPRTQLRKKENHRTHKSSRSSGSSSDSTVQLISLLDSVKKHSDCKKHKQRSEVKKPYMTDGEAIAALKYLPLKPTEIGQPIKGDVYRKKKLQKLILSTVEIKSEIPTSLEKTKSNKSLNNRYGSKARILIPTQENEFLYQPSQDSKIRMPNNSHYSVETLLDDQALEDYVTKDKYDEKNSDRSQTILKRSNSSVGKKSNQSVYSSGDEKVPNKKRQKVHSSGVRSRMLCYSRSVEHRKKRARGSMDSIRDSSDERENNNLQRSNTKVYTSFDNSNEIMKKRSQSISGASMSSDLSLNSDSERQSDKCKLKAKNVSSNELKVEKECTNMSFDTVKTESTDTVKVSSEVLSALTKITEETISQDSLIGSDFSHCSKKEDPKLSLKANSKSDKYIVKENNVVQAPIVKNLKQNETLGPKNVYSSKHTKIPKPLELKSLATSKPKSNGLFDSKDYNLNLKKNNKCQYNRNGIVENVNNFPTTEKKESYTLLNLKEEELCLLTEKVKSIIMNEMQAMNNVTIQTLMQIIGKKNEETDKNALENIISKNIESALRGRLSSEHVDYKKQERKSNDLQCLKNENVGDFKSDSTKKLQLGDKSSDFIGSIKSSKSSKFNQKGGSSNTIKFLETDTVKNNENLSNTQKFQFVSDSTIDHISDKAQSINSPSLSCETNISSAAKPKAKRVSKLARRIPKSVLNKDLLNKNKPASAPTSFDKNQTNKLKRNVTNFFEKSVTSDTKTSLASTRIGSAKESFRTFVSTKDTKGTSKFEKRKQYGEFLRQKLKVVKNENDTVIESNHKPDVCKLVNCDNTINESIEEKSTSQEPPPDSYNTLSHSSTNENLSDMFAFMKINNNTNGASGLHQNEVCSPIETSNNFMTETTSTKPKEADSKSVTNPTTLNKQLPTTIHQTQSKESTNIYQTFTVMANHHHIEDIFRNKFKKSNGFLENLNRGSLCSTLSSLSLNRNGKNGYSTKSNTLSWKKSENMLHRFDKVKSVLSCNERPDVKNIFNRKNESGMTLFSNSTPESTSLTSNSSTDCSSAKLKKVSRVKINLSETCKQYNNTQPKYALYSPYISYRNITKTAEKDYSTFNSVKDTSDTNLHRCQHKFNIHSMLKTNQRFEKCSCRFVSKQNRKNVFALTSDIPNNSRNNNKENYIPIRLSRFVQRNERDRQGKYVVFKIDKKLQLEPRNSKPLKDTSRECFKIFMNNNVHKMQLDSDYPLRFSKYGYESKLFDNTHPFTNKRLVLESTNDENNSINNKKEKEFMHALNKEIDTSCSKKKFSTVITFPFNLKMTNSSTNLKMNNILSAEKDNGIDASLNKKSKKVFPKSKLEQLYDSVTNLYNDLCNTKSNNNLISECDTGYLTDFDQHYQNRNNRGKHERLRIPSELYSSNSRDPERGPSTSTNKAFDRPAEVIKIFNIESFDSINTSVKNIQTDQAKLYDHKLIQANLKRKHKRNTIPHELITRSTSYDLIKREEKIPILDVVQKSDLINMLQSNPEFYELITVIVKKILTNVGVLPTAASQDILRSIVEQSFHSITRDSTKDKEQQVSYSDSSISKKSEMAQTKFSVNDKLINEIRKKEMSKEIKDLQQQLVRENVSPNNNVSLLFENIVVELLQDVIKKVVDIQESFDTMNKNESRNMLKEAEKTISERKFITIDDRERLLLYKPLSTANLSNTSSQNSVSSQKGKLSMTQSLVNDLKAFENILKDLKCSIAKASSSERVIECNSLETSSWTVANNSSYKSNSTDDVLKKNSCKCLPCQSSEANQLLQIMSKLPLSTIITLYKKFTNSNEPEISFESLIQKLNNTDLLNNKIDKLTKSQNRIWKALRSLTGGENKNTNSEEDSKFLSLVTTQVAADVNAKKEKDINCDNSLLETKEKIEMQADCGNNNLKLSDSVNDTKRVENEKQSDHTIVKEISKKKLILTEDDKSGISNEEPSGSNQVRKYETNKRLKKAVENENKRLAFDKIKQNLTDKELFDKLLESYENEEKIVYRLSNDEEFLKSQLQMVKTKESIEGLLKQPDLPFAESIDEIVEELEDITEDTNYKKPNRSSININTSKKSSSKFFTLKSKVSRLFKSSTNEIKEVESTKKYPSQNRTIEEVETRREGKLKFNKEKKMEKYTKDESSLSSNDSNSVKPQEIGKYFMRGFRGDQMLLNGGFSGKPMEQKQHKDDSSIESIIEFSERDTPLEYLLALGYSIEEASNAIKDEDVENRLLAAITEARIWVNQVNTVQGTLLYLIAYKAKPKIMRYYLQLVEAIVNNRINNAVKLDSFLKVLEKVEDGDISMLYILGSDKFEEEENEEYLLKKQLRKVFIDVYRVAQNEVESRNEVLTKNQINLLKILAAKYRAGLQSHLEIVALYIGKGLLRSQAQLEGVIKYFIITGLYAFFVLAAMIYFSRLDTSEINLAKFEKYCGIKSKT